MQPLVSILIPAYNHEKYVQESIQSVISQDYQNIELIILDDGSKDSTLHKIEELKDICEKRFVNFKYLSRENQGTCVTCNELLKMATGKYVGLFASDDRYEEHAISSLVDVLEKDEEVALAFGINKIIDSDGKYCFWNENFNNIYEENKCKWKSFTDCLKDVHKIDFKSNDLGSYESLFLGGNHIGNGYLIRKSVFDIIGYFTKDAPLEDYWLMLQIAKYAKMKFVDIPTFCYRWHGDNTASQKERMISMENKTICHEMSEVAKSFSLNDKCLDSYKKFRESLLLITKDNYQKANKLNDDLTDCQSRFDETLKKFLSIYALLKFYKKILKFLGKLTRSKTLKNQENAVTNLYYILNEQIAKNKNKQL